MLSVQNYGQMNQMNMGFKAKKLPPKATQDFKALYSEMAQCKKFIKEYPEKMKKLNEAFEGYKISFEEYSNKAKYYLEKLEKCCDFLRK